MRKTIKTDINKAFDHVKHVQAIMTLVEQGLSRREISRQIEEENLLSIDSPTARQTIKNSLFRHYIEPFDVKTLKTLSKIFISEKLPLQVKRELLFVFMCETDDLAKILTLDILYPAYANGEGSISRRDMADFVSKKTGYADLTVSKCVGGYLTLTNRIGITSLDNSTIRLNFFQAKKETFTILLFLLFQKKMTPAKIVRAETFRFLLLDELAIVRHLQSLASQGLVDFAMAGGVIRLEPKIEFEGVPDVLKL
ncbi:MAG TPA: hypothetical protein DCE14_08910 [Kosmotogaceae bacterium]|nr:MAG: Uncharacterized protein XE05_1216 [Thermotogales bacterium 46_20]HAA86446.1 hypothetical protein [Kosmotogaceae bacterium]